MAVNGSRRRLTDIKSGTSGSPIRLTGGLSCSPSWIGPAGLPSRSAFEVHDVLSSHVGRVLLANPVDLKRFRSGRHTDRVDAARLAKMLAVETIPSVVSTN